MTVAVRRCLGAATIVVSVVVSVVAGAPELGARTVASPVRLTPAVTSSSPHVTLPPVNGRFDYQIGGAYPPANGVRIVDRDHLSHPASGIYSICYINAFQTQPGRDRWWRQHHPRLLLRNASGAVIGDPGWPGEILLNTSTAEKRATLARIESAWLAGCEKRGFQAVEPDNLDSYSRSHGRLTVAENFRFARRLVVLGHHDGLAVAQKNDAEHSHEGRTDTHFDFAIAEECQVYSECSYYTKQYGDHLIEIEYTDNGRAAFRAACRARGDRISIILRDRQVVPRRHHGYVNRYC